jgi:hypothetical protein
VHFDDDLVALELVPLVEGQMIGSVVRDARRV